MRLGRSGAAALLAVAVAACSGGAGGAGAPSAAPSASSSAAPVELQVYAAASLKGVLAKAKGAYETAHPGVTLSISTDSSAALEAKIEQGAPADVFLSADTSNPQKLVDAGLAAGSLVRFAANFLTIIVPADDPAGVTSPKDLARSGLKIIAAGDTVPVTKYATRLVANLAGLPGYPAGFEAAYAANVVSKEDNVAAVVAKIELGEGDAGIVYVTDARSSSKVRTIPVPETANVAATYGGVAVKASANAPAAAAFLAWLTGSDGKAILASFGFLPPG